MKKFVTTILLGLTQAKDSCTALVLSGGGANGAWEAGIFWGLNFYGNQGDFDYDVISGVSAGSINTAALAGWAPEDGKRAAEWLSQTMQDAQTSDIWAEWPLGPVAGATVKPGLFNDGPMLQFLRTQMGGFPEGYKRRVVASALDVETGEYTPFTSDDTTFYDFADAAVSSSSIPFIFPPHQWHKGTFMDGGTVWNVNLDSAIEQCLKVVNKPEKITVDVVECSSPPVPDSRWSLNNDAASDYLYARNIHSFYSDGDNLAEQKKAYPEVNFRYLFQQREYQLSGLDELKFDNATTWPLQVNGRQVAQETLQAGEGAIFKLFDEYKESDELKKAHGHWINYLSSKLPSYLQ